MGLELTASNIVKRFGERELFSIEQLQVQEGESLHLSGDNGVGKTTLMKILAGLDKPCAGRINVTPNMKGRWSTSLHPKVIYLHQTPYVFSGSVKDNIAYGLKLKGISRGQIKRTVQSALEWARLEEFADHAAHSLSGGEKQRLALARAWVLTPGLLFLDEPTANLDKQSVDSVTELVRKMVDGGAAVMISSHQTNPLTELCQRGLLLADGKVSESQFPKEMLFDA